MAQTEDYRSNGQYSPQNETSRAVVWELRGSPANSMELTQNFSVSLLAILLCRGAPVCAPCHCVVLLLGRHVCAQNTSKQRNNKNNCPSDRGTRNLQVNFGGSIKKRLNATEQLVLSPTPCGYSLFITKKRESFNCRSTPSANDNKTQERKDKQ